MSAVARGVAVIGYGITADEEVLNLMGVE